MIQVDLNNGSNELESSRISDPSQQAPASPEAVPAQQPKNQWTTEMLQKDAQKLKLLKLKAGVFLLLLLAYLFWPYAQESKNHVDALISQNASLVNQIDKIQLNLDQAKTDKELGDYASWLQQQNSNSIGECYKQKFNCEFDRTTNNNTARSCSFQEIKCSLLSGEDQKTVDINKELFANISYLRNYLLLQNLSSEKTEFDQKKVLTNLFEYLNKAGWVEVWNIAIISFGAPKLLDYDNKLYELPITLNIDFLNKERLLEFLSNIEYKVTTGQPVLYDVQNLTYDVVRNNENQTVTMTIGAYFYK